MTHDQQALMAQLRTSHDAWALFKKLQLLHSTGHVGQETVDQARDFARQVKVDLLKMLGLPG